MNYFFCMFLTGIGINSAVKEKSILIAGVGFCKNPLFISVESKACLKSDHDCVKNYAEYNFVTMYTTSYLPLLPKIELEDLRCAL